MTLIDLHVVLTYYCHCFLVFNIWASHALEMTIHFHYPTLELFCFSFTQPFTHSKFCSPNPFLFDATLRHKWPALTWFRPILLTDSTTFCIILYFMHYVYYLKHEQVCFIRYKTRGDNHFILGLRGVGTGGGNFSNVPFFRWQSALLTTWKMSLRSPFASIAFDLWLHLFSYCGMSGKILLFSVKNHG